MCIVNPIVFKTEREFNKAFPSGMFLCTNCGSLTENRRFCKICGWRADGLLGTQDKGLKYTILETNESEEIFTPIEYKTKEEEENG